MNSHFDFSWLKMSAFQAQSLSYIAIVLFVIAFALLLIGTLTKLNKRQTHWLTLTAFASCTMLGIVTSIIYYWHHYLRAN